MSTVFVSDTISDTVGTLLHNHTGSTGATWSRHPNTATNSTWRIAANGVYPNSLGTGLNPSMFLASGQPLSAEYMVEWDYYHLSGYGNAGIIVRASPTARTWYHVYHGAGAGSTQEWVIAKHVNGLITTLDAQAETLSATDQVSCRFVVENGAKVLYVDYGEGGGWEELIGTADNQAVNAGRVGLRSAFQYGDNEGKQITNLVATDNASPAERAMAIIIGD